MPGGPSPVGRRWTQSEAKGTDEGEVSIETACPSSAATRHLLPTGEGPNTDAPHARSRVLSQSPGALFRRDWSSLVYVIALFWAAFAAIQPIWTGIVPGLTDFGGHLALIDAWVKLDDVPLYGETFQRRSEVLSPNLLAARFADLLYPVVDTANSIKVFLTVSILATIGAVLWLIRLFARSRWLIFLCIPMVWGTMLGLGMINYVASIPLIFLAIGLARQGGVTGRWRYAIGLLLVCLLAFFTHGIGYVFVAASAGFVLTVSIRPKRALLHYLAFVPSLVLWGWWLSNSDLGENVGVSDPASATSVLERSKFLPPMEFITTFLENSHDILVTDEDTGHFLAAFLIWLVLMALPRGRTAVSQGQETSTKEETSATTPARQFLVKRVRHLWRGLCGAVRNVRSRPLLMLVLWVGAMLYFLPAEVDGMAVSYRLTTNFCILLMLLPSVSRPSFLRTIAFAGAVFVSISWTGAIQRSMEEFSEQEIQPLARIIERIPPQQRVQCVGTSEVSSFFNHRPLRHNCVGLIHYLSQSFAGPDFARDAYNAVSYPEDVRFVSLEGVPWYSSGAVLGWDYVIVRGAHRRPTSGLLQQIHSEQAVVEDAPTWTLYQVIHQDSTPTTLSGSAGGQGGQAVPWNCPVGHALSGFRSHPHDQLVGNIEPQCHAINAGEGTIQYSGSPSIGPTFGSPGRGRQLTCPSGKLAIGIFGRATLYVDQLGLICAEVAAEQDAGYRVVEESEVLSNAQGGSGGQPFELRCSEGSVIHGVRIGSAAWIDSVGIYCSEIDELMNPEAPE